MGPSARSLMFTTRYRRDKWFTWAAYQATPATEERVRQWYRNGRTEHRTWRPVSMVTLGVAEFDCRDTYDAFLEAAVEAGLGELVNRVRTGYEEFTPGGGVHWLVPIARSSAGKTQLAERTDPVFTSKAAMVLVETRGEGGFIVIAPSNGKTHPSGGSYTAGERSTDELLVLCAQTEQNEL